MAPRAAHASIALLRGIGRSVTVLDNCCCGLPAETYGDREAAQLLAGRNLPLLEGFDLVVTDCSSCAAYLKKYPQLFPEGHTQHEAAEAVAGRVRDLVELLAEAQPPPPERDGSLVVTWHDPCHASRGQGIRDEPRDVLTSLPGIEFRELPEADWCCGGAGSYALSHYELSRQVLDRKMDNLERTRADVLATSCPACIIQLAYGVRLRGLPVRVCHLSELLAPGTRETDG